MFPNALCRTYDPNLWFAVAKKSPDNDRAIAICQRCPERDACLAYGLEWAEYGIYGGTTADERKALRREQGVTLRSYVDA
jgi:WhiB family transcriptional regulator, redox-sensing transcriptional regulator